MVGLLLVGERPHARRRPDVHSLLGRTRKHSVSGARDQPLWWKHVELRCGGELFIFDAGSGLRELGKSLTGQSVSTHIFLSHCHFDHVCGLPFFEPCYSPDSRISIWAGNLVPRFTLSGVIGQMMASPLFPISKDAFEAGIRYRDFRAGETLRPSPEVLIKTIPLNHPDGATGYRLEFAGRSVAYVTDHEAIACVDRELVALLMDTDVLILDCTFTREQIAARSGWGHSSWDQGIKLAKATRAGLFCLFHHDPDHDDDRLDDIAKEVSSHYPRSLVAKEGLVLEVQEPVLAAPESAAE